MNNNFNYMLFTSDLERYNDLYRYITNNYKSPISYNDNLDKFINKIIL